MLGLFVTSFIWAFSFSFIGVYLSGDVDSYIAILIRVVIALIVLLPFSNITKISRQNAFWIMMTGALQVGLMYIAYYNSFHYLSVPEVVLQTAVTPIYITLISDMLDRKFRFQFLLAVVLAVLAGIFLRFTTFSDKNLTGIALIQLANLFFAASQMLYKRKVHSEYHHFAFFFLGALIVIVPAVIFFSDFSLMPTTITQWGVLGWLGIVASSIGYLLWNRSARKVSSGTLAVMNNVTIPLAILVNLFFWNREYPVIKLFFGTLIIVMAILLTRIQLKMRKVIINL